MKNAGGTFLFLFLVACFACAGAFVALRPSEAERAAAIQREQEAHDLALAKSRALAPYERAFKIAGMVIILAILAGAGYGAARVISTEANLIRADRSGLFPVVKGKVGKATYYHDPNRSPTPTTLYAQADDAPSVSVVHVVPKGMEDAQLQVTTQAQVAQAVRASVSGGVLEDHTKEALKALTEGGRRLPKVKVLEAGPEHIERLLAGGEDDGEWS